MTKIVIKHQIVSADGDNILQPYFDRTSAEYMVSAYFPGAFIIEVEEEIL